MGGGNRSDEVEANTGEIIRVTQATANLWKESSPKVRKEAIESFTSFVVIPSVDYSPQLKELVNIVDSDPEIAVKKEAISTLEQLFIQYLRSHFNYSRQYKKLLSIASSANTEMEIREAIIDAFKEIRKWERPHPSLTPRFIRKIDKAIQKNLILKKLAVILV